MLTQARCEGPPEGEQLDSLLTGATAALLPAGRGPSPSLLVRGGASALHDRLWHDPEVFADPPKDVTVQKRQREVAAPFVALGALLGVAAMAASIRWSAHP